MPNFADNRKAHFEYEIIDTFEAGISLTGGEVKSVRNGGAKLAGSFVVVKPSGAVLLNAHIARYKNASQNILHTADRTRDLLLAKREIHNLREKLQTKGLTIVPLSLYPKGRLIKLKIALVKGKKQYDKRATLRKRDTDREIKRALKRAR